MSSSDTEEAMLRFALYTRTFLENVKAPMMAFMLINFYLFSVAGYDVSSKSYDLNKVVDVMFVSKGLEFTLIECNKVFAMAGFTLLMLSWFPFFSDRQASMVITSILLIMIHSAYSQFKYYGYSPQRIMQDNARRQFGLVLGALAVVSALAGNYGVIPSDWSLVGTVSGACMHFFLMKCDSEGQMATGMVLKPMAFIPGMAAVALFFLRFHAGLISYPLYSSMTGVLCILMIIAFVPRKK